MGRVLDFQQNRISFDAQVPHCVIPWKGGSRVVLVAFTVKNHNRLAAQDSTDLSDLGFQVPMLANSTVSATDSGSVGVRKCLPPPSGFPSSSPARVPVVLVPNETAAKPTPSDPTAGPGSKSLSTRTGEAASLADSTSGVMRVDGHPCKPSFLEIFCGSAGLSVEMRKLGFQVLGWIISPLLSMRAPRSSIWTCVTLSSRLAYGPKSSGRMLSGWRPLVAHLLLLAPYLSRARSSGPRPLRSKSCPDGLQNLAANDAARVVNANALYEFASKVFSFCLKRDIVCIVENPASSLMWETTWFRHLVIDSKSCWHELHSCMCGSSRRKRTGLLCTVHLPGLLRKCDNSHAHRAWGRTRTAAGWGFATAEETPYPLGLCQAAARDISLVLKGRGVCIDARQSTDTAAAATNAQKQPRRGRGTVGPSEYKLTVLARSPASCVPPDTVPENPPDYLAGLPVGSKLLWTRVVLDGGVEVREAEYGVYYTPQEFVHEALKVTHPFDSAVTIDGPNLRAIAFTLEHGVKAVIQSARPCLSITALSNDPSGTRRLFLRRAWIPLCAKLWDPRTCCSSNRCFQMLASPMIGSSRIWLMASV